MATSDRFRLNGVLDTFVVEGTSSNYTIKNTSGTTYASVVNGAVQSNTSDPIFNSNLANGNYSNTINQALSSMSGSSVVANASNNNPNSQANTNSGTTSTSSSSPNSSQQTSASSGTLRYPINMDPNQDYVRFEVMKLKKSPTGAAQNLANSLANTQSKGFGAGADYNLYTSLNEIVILPIQASITDQNTVDWGPGQLNELQRMLGKTSLEAMTSNDINKFTEAFGKGFKDIYDQIKGNNLIYAALLEQAIQAPGLTSRLTGGVLNPNMELLFQGPQLRPFNFTFKMSPRSKVEANSVRNIIKTFKKNMAPRVENIFLASPHVFKIGYYHGRQDKVHESMNLIKVCALQNCSIDYTPLGTYATFDDGDDGDPKASMVSYTMSLTFTEINPIYQEDYDSHSIGF